MLSYKLKIAFNKIKKDTWAYILCEKQPNLKVFSSTTELTVTLGDFTVRNTILGMEICI